MNDDGYPPDDDPIDDAPLWIPPLTFWLVVVAIIASIAALRLQQDSLNRPAISGRSTAIPG